MGIGSDREPSFETRIRHVKRGEHRVAEMECHVQSLREKLCRLEKMLPQNDEIERPRFTEDVCKEKNYKTDGTTKVCPVDELAKKEKFLRQQIYDMECTEQAYMRQLADLKEKRTGEQRKNADLSPTAPKKNRDEIAKERLSLLESYSQKLCTNLQNLQKNRVNLAQEAQNLTQVLDKTRMACAEKQKGSQDSPPCDKDKKKQCVECSCKKLAKCDSCIVCSCDEWEKDMEINNEEKKPKTCTFDKKIPVKREKCNCYEMVSSSDSEESCDECQHIQKKLLNDAYCCNCQDLDVDSDSSYCSNDDKTMYSEKSKCTCFCSKNQSHEDLLVYNDKPMARETKMERFRGGLDTINTYTSVMNIESSQKPPNDFPSMQNTILDRLKLVKVEEIREGLERLKIRNRNLKDFLNTLENPLTLMNKPSEVTSICTQVSSCYTVDMAKETRSGLLTVVKVLEGKCRNKNATILALVDELKTGSNKNFQVKNIEPGIERMKTWKNVSPDKKIGRAFTKKDSAIGFVLFALILISHIKKCEMISYLSTAKRILTETSFQLVTFINQSDRFSVDFLFELYDEVTSLAKIFVKNVYVKWEEIILRLNEFYKPSSVQIRDHLNVALTHLVNNWFYVASALGIISVILLIARFRKTIVKYFSFLNFAKLKKVFNLFDPILRIFHEQVLSSRIFWLILGFCSHMLWNIIEPNFIKLIDLLGTFYENDTQKNSPENHQQLVVMEDPDCELFEFFNYSWIVSMFCANFQSLVELSYHILKNIVV